MSIYQLKEHGTYYYRFQVAGEIYTGKCVGCDTKREAEAYEKKKRALVVDVSEAKSVTKIIERKRAELTGNKDPIKLVEAFDKSLEKPRAKQPAPQQVALKRMMFSDFTAFMAAKYPAVVDLAEVTKAHAEAYIAHIQTKGRFMPKNTKNNKLSNTTLRKYHQAISEVFTVLAEDAGIERSPFASIAKPSKQENSREIFTLQELALIFNNLDSFTRPLFTLATLTALREGDICMLRWRDVDMANRIIKIRTRKTGATTEIVMSPKVYELFRDQQPVSGDGIYVFPEHADMYTKNRSGVPYRVKKFLNDIGIETNRENENGRRSSSVKDLHSCRHSFAYYTTSGCGISLSTAKALLGHTTLDMTEHYADHSTMLEKQKVANTIEGVLFEAPAVTDGLVLDPKRKELEIQALRALGELQAEIASIRPRLPVTVDALNTLIKACTTAIEVLQRLY